MSFENAAVRGDLDAASNVLVLADAFDSGAVCEDLLAEGGSDRVNVLAVVTRDPDRHARNLVERTGPVGNLHYVVLTELQQSVPETFGEDLDVSRATAAAVDPRDLTGIGIEASKRLAEWAPLDARTVVCFDSLTTLLQYVDVKTLFRFLNLLTQRVRSVDARAHYHLDPDVHDGRTVSTLSQLVDAVVEIQDA